jgi:hypothetical protein
METHSSVSTVFLHAGNIQGCHDAVTSAIVRQFQLRLIWQAYISLDVTLQPGADQLAVEASSQTPPQTAIWFHSLQEQLKNMTRMKRTKQFRNMFRWTEPFVRANGLMARSGTPSNFHA